MDMQKTFSSFILAVSVVLCGAVTGCVFKPVSRDLGFAVGSADRQRFDHDVNVCEEQATRMGFDEGMSVPDQSIRAGAIQRCLREKGWTNGDAKPAATP